MIHPGFLLALLGAALLSEGRGRLPAALATVASGLALAGLRAGPASPELLPAGFVAVEAALLTLGATLAISSAFVALRSERSSANVAGSAVAGVGGVLLALHAARWVARAPIGGLVAALVTVAGLGYLLCAAGRLIPRSLVAKERRRGPRMSLVAIALGTLLAAVGPAAGHVFLGTVLVGFGGWRMRWVEGDRPLPIAPLLTSLVIPAWWLMSTIAGPEGLAVVTLPDLPWSPAAERLLALVLIVASWAASGLWPLHREEPAALTSLAGALLVLRVVIPAVPDGLAHWRALAMPVVVIGLWHAVATDRRDGVAVALAWIGLMSGEPPGQLGAALLIVAALLLELCIRISPASAVARRALGATAALLAGVGGLFAIEAGLRAEVVYTVLAVAALVTGCGRLSLVQASTASVPRATAPRA
jgi:hypothetical protein